MKPHDIILLSVFGVTIWIVGTIYYAYHGRALLEATPLIYWRNFIISAVLSVAMCLAILRWRRISAANWAPAMLLLAIPGMVGEAVVLSHLTTFMPKLQAASGGRYGAVLFATYALVLGVAEVVTLKATR